MPLMQALLLTSPGRLALTELDIPPVGPGEVRIRVAACGICGSDVHGYTGATGRRIPPLVMGHEAAGRIGLAVTAALAARGGTVAPLAEGPDWFARLEAREPGLVKVVLEP